jgi:hypothetical protein
MASYSEPESNKINIYLPKFNVSDSDYLKYGFVRVKLNDIKIKLGLGRHGKKVNVKKS